MSTNENSDLWSLFNDISDTFSEENNEIQEKKI